MELNLLINWGVGKSAGGYKCGRVGKSVDRVGISGVGKSVDKSVDFYSSRDFVNIDTEWWLFGGRFGSRFDRWWWLLQSTIELWIGFYCVVSIVNFLLDWIFIALNSIATDCQ